MKEPFRGLLPVFVGENTRHENAQGVCHDRNGDGGQEEDSSPRDSKGHEIRRRRCKRHQGHEGTDPGTRVGHFELQVGKKHDVPFPEDGDTDQTQGMLAEPGSDHFQRKSDGVVEDVRDRHHEEEERQRKKADPEPFPAEHDPEEPSRDENEGTAHREVFPTGLPHHQHRHADQNQEDAGEQSPLRRERPKFGTTLPDQPCREQRDEESVGEVRVVPPVVDQLRHDRPVQGGDEQEGEGKEELLLLGVGLRVFHGCQSGMTRGMLG